MTRLTIEDVVHQAWTATTPDLDDGAAQRMDASRDAVNAIAERRAVYGRTTGVGANRSVTISADQRRHQDMRLLRSHASASGPELPDHVVRAMLLIRRQQMQGGGSGLGSAAAHAVTACLLDGDLPIIHAHGSIGTGDLSALAEAGLALAGEGRRRSGGTQQQWEPQGGDALPFISSNALTLAQAAFAVATLDRWLDHYAFVTAASLVALNGNREAYAQPVQDARPHQGQHEVSTAVRAALEGVPVVSARVQDSFGLRTVPQVVAPLRFAIDHLRTVVETEINSTPENPLYDTTTDEVFHHGNFHAHVLSLAADQVAIALAGAAQLSLLRLSSMCDPAMSGAEPFLSDSEPGSSGVMVLEYVSAAALSRLRGHASPASLGLTVVSRGAEEHASFASAAVHQVVGATDEARTVLACELLAAQRAVTTRPAEIPAGTPLARYLRAFPTSTSLADRPLTAEVQAVEQRLHLDLFDVGPPDSAGTGRE